MADTTNSNQNTDPNNNGKFSPLDQLREKQKQIQAKIEALEAKNKIQTRKEDTRLKVLIGAAFLADVQHHEETRAGIKTVLQRAITAVQDKEFLKEKGWLPNV
jgi:hypothetical protein